jgi:hypothetical protein
MSKDNDNESHVISIQNNNLYENLIKHGIDKCESILLSANSKEIEYYIIDKIEYNKIIYLLGIDFHSQEDDDLILIEISNLNIKIFFDYDSISKFFQLKEEYDNENETIGKLEFKDKIFIINHKDFNSNSEDIYINSITNAVKNLNISNPEFN